MAQISNNTLAALLLVTIVILVVGMFAVTIPVIQITGAAAGVTNLTVQSLASIKMVRNISDFGTGTPLPSGTRYIITNGTNAGGFNNGSEGNGSNYGTGTYVYPFVIENDGNDDSTCVNVTAGSTPSTFIGGTGATFELISYNNESASCTSGSKPTWTSISTSPPVTVCSALRYDTGNDEIIVHWRIGIPDNAPAAVKSNTMTINGYGDC